MSNSRRGIVVVYVVVFVPEASVFLTFELRVMVLFVLVEIGLMVKYARTGGV